MFAMHNMVTIIIISNLMENSINCPRETGKLIFSHWKVSDSQFISKDVCCYAFYVNRKSSSNPRNEKSELNSFLPLYSNLQDYTTCIMYCVAYLCNSSCCKSSHVHLALWNVMFQCNCRSHHTVKGLYVVV